MTAGMLCADSASTQSVRLTARHAFSKSVAVNDTLCCHRQHLTYDDSSVCECQLRENVCALIVQSALGHG